MKLDEMTIETVQVKILNDDYEKKLTNLVKILLEIGETTNSRQANKDESKPSENLEAA